MVFSNNDGQLNSLDNHETKVVFTLPDVEDENVSEPQRRQELPHTARMTGKAQVVFTLPDVEDEDVPQPQCCHELTHTARKTGMCITPGVYSATQESQNFGGDTPKRGQLQI